MRFILFSICFILLVSHPATSQTFEWISKIQQIVPIISTEKDVEKLYGKPNKRSAHFAEYETDYGYLSFEYSTGECSHPSYYSVANGVVIGIDISLKKELLFNKIKIDRSKFIEEHSDDTENITYRSPILGITYGTYPKKLENVHYDKRPKILTGISIYPASKYDYLICPAIEKTTKNL